MKISVVYSKRKGLKEIEKGVDIIILAERLFGMLLCTTNEQAMMVIYKIGQYREATLDLISTFFFPILTEKQLIALLKEKIEEIGTIEYIRQT